MHPTKPAQLLDLRAAERLNLAVLKRIDLAIEEVLASANHVALYDFDQKSNQWERKEVEGSLFLIRRNEEPCCQIIILNKKSTHNYVEDVHPGFQFEKSRPYLLYRNKDDEVVGIWFYEADEADKVERLLQQITAAHVAHPGAQEASPAALGGSEDGSFWDQRAASPPPDFNPFGCGPAKEQQQPLPLHQQQQPAQPQHRQAHLVGLQDSLSSRGHQHVRDHVILQDQQQPVQQPAAAMCSSFIPMPQAGLPLKDLPALGSTPSRLASGHLKGVNVLRQGSAMTPEQSNLAKLLCNMRVASGGGHIGEGPPQSQPPQGSSPPAVQGQAATAFSTPQQPPSLHQSGVLEVAHAQDPEEAVASVLASRPVLLTPKFLAGNQQHQVTLEQSHTASNVAPHISVLRTSSETLSASGLHASQAECLNGTSLHRFFPRACEHLPPSTAAMMVKEQEVGGVREKLRDALMSLSKSERFLDLLAQELQAAGIMQL